jgi:hypothetical protein
MPAHHDDTSKIGAARASRQYRFQAQCEETVRALRIDGILALSLALRFFRMPQADRAVKRYYRNNAGSSHDPHPP